MIVRFSKTKTCFILWLFAAALPAGAENTTFRSRLNFKLCPEYILGGVTLEYKYRVGADPNFIALAGQNQQINSGNQTGSVDVTLPSTFGQTPLAVAAFCRNSFGLGPASAERLVSNCDAAKFRDSDGDGLTDSQEDINCNDKFDPGEPSNLWARDTDGDGRNDINEALEGTSPVNAGSSLRPWIYAGDKFDPDGNGNSNAATWRPSNGNWFIRDLVTLGNNIAFQFGLNGDIPFFYNYRVENPAPPVAGMRFSDVGVIRRIGFDYVWLFHGRGFEQSNGTFKTSLAFGSYGDYIILGPWEKPGVTNPAVAHVYNGVWYFYILKSNGSVDGIVWGGNGDLPKPADYDGDGIFDIAVYRPSEQKTYIIRSTNGLGMVHKFGTGTADSRVVGNYTNDNVHDIAFWEPITALFTVMKSDNGFDDVQAANQNPAYYLQMNLGAYEATLPLNWQFRGGKQWFSVVDHTTGVRQLRDPRNPGTPVESLQWGLPGDAQG